MKATCKRCGNQAMGCASMEDAAEAVFNIEHGFPAFAVLECAYCGNNQRTRDDDELYRAYHDDSDMRRLWGRKVAQEREKVARLQEGRW